MRILAIDPGNTQSALLVYDTELRQPFSCQILLNEAVLLELDVDDCDALAMEYIASMGMSVGQSIFDTAIWSGRFIERWRMGKDSGNHVEMIKRVEVKKHLCGTHQAKDGNIRQALMDRYGSTREAAIGKKASPGPLYEVSTHLWAALGVAITAAER